MLCLSEWIKRRSPTMRAALWIWAIPPTNTQVEANFDTRKDPLPRPQQPLICGYHAAHRVLRRVGLSPPLKYVLPTTDQEVHEVHTRICEILAAAAVGGKLHLQACRTTQAPTYTPLRANTNAET